jgi:hypothetical protein
MEEVIERARAEPWARPGVQRLYRIADALRGIDDMRRQLTRRGEEAWDALQDLARIETELLNEWPLE